MTSHSSIADCPSDDQLRQLLGSNANEAAQLPLEQHLNTCERCQQRLDELSGAAYVPPHVGDTNASTAGQLTDVIRNLQGVSPTGAWDQSGASKAASRPDRSHSFLQPATSPGLLGRLGKYQVQHILGQGGMGVVFAAQDPDLKRQVAIKVPAQSFVATGAAIDRFIREARSIASVKHENIVTVFAVEKQDDTPFLVMELIEGESLADRIATQGALPWREVAEIGSQISAALAAAHPQGIVHRDIKPANVLLERATDTAKLTDFGLAKSANDGSLTESGVVIGTPEFMSPEQADERPLTPSTDLFSLGAVLYAACSGSSPFRGRSALDSLKRVCLSDVTPLHQRNADIPRWFSDLVASLLKKQPQNRPQSAADVLQLIESGLTADSIEPGSRPPLQAYGLASIAILAVCCVVALVAMNRDDTPVALPTERVHGFYVAGTDAPFDNLAEAIQAAPNPGLIEIIGDGPYLLSDSIAVDKVLTVRAAAGFDPVIMNRPDAASRETPFVETTADLTLQGLHIRWAIKPRPAASLEDTGQSCMIHVSNAELRLNNCRLVAGRRNGCLMVQRGSVELRDSDLIASSGACCFWLPADEDRLTAENCVLDGRTGLMVDGYAEQRRLAAGQIHLNRNTIRAQRAVQLLLSMPIRPFSVDARENAFDTDNVMVVARFSGRPMQSRFANDAARKLFLQNQAPWIDESNAYRVGTTYLSMVWARRPNLTDPIVDSLDAWSQLWGNSGTSQEAEFHYKSAEEGVSDRRSIEIRAPSGEVLAGFGATPVRAEANVR